MSAAIYWKVDPAPTGRYRSFQRRNWPTAYYKGSDEYFVGGEWYTIDLTTFVGDSNMVAFFRRKVTP